MCILLNVEWCAHTAAIEREEGLFRGWQRRERLGARHAKWDQYDALVHKRYDAHLNFSPLVSSLGWFSYFSPML
jgi:hypothetical protein